jgi:hypothetical protein
MVAPFREREDNVMRNSIPTSQRLSSTLRFLATGQEFEDLKFTTAVERQTMSETPLFLMRPP